MQNLCLGSINKCNGVHLKLDVFYFVKAFLCM